MRSSTAYRPRGSGTGISAPILALVALFLAASPARGDARFVRGDCGADGRIDISDPLRILFFGFGGGITVECLDACDVDDDGQVGADVTDAVLLLEYLFLRGPSPPEPFPGCGPDPTPDELGCDTFSVCPPPPTVTLVRTDPTDGETGVAVTRETILQFSGPLAPAPDPLAVRALFRGEELAHRLHTSPDRQRLTLFYDAPLPASARIRVEIDGARLRSADDLPVDLDGDGSPGDILLLEFDTLSITRLPGTHVCGRVFASELRPSPEGLITINTPLAGVRITADGIEDELFAITDQFGDFRLEDAPAGRFFVHIDGRTARNGVPPGAYYPFVGKAWKSVPGEETNIGEIYLPLVQAGTLQEASQTEDTIVTFADSVLDELPELAGVTLTVPADSLYSDDGSRGGMVGIAPVPPDRLPGTLPPGLNFPLVITVQTDGATNFDEPAPICFPNLPDPSTGEILPPGASSALWSFNHDTGRFEVVGSMTVGDDGQFICSDPGVGILAPGWHGSAPGSSGPIPCTGPECDPEDEPEPPCDDCDCREPPARPTPQPFRLPMHQLARGLTDPVYLHSGEFYLEAIDLRIPGRGFDFIWARKYRSRIGPDTEQGKGWDYSYNVRLEQEGDEVVRVHDGNSRSDPYHRLPDGTFALRGFFRELRLGLSPTLTFADGGFWEFHPLDGSPVAGKIAASEDRNGNRMTFAYDARGRLVRITDTLDRDVEITYNADGFIESVTDFAGRILRYEYHDGTEPGGSFGDLKSVTTPSVAGTPNNNDFPQGKTTTYTYTTGFGSEKLNHNLLTVTDGRRNDPGDPTFGEGPFLENVYSGSDRITRQVWGDDIVDIVYLPRDPTPANGFVTMKTIVNDRQGNVKEFHYDVGNFLVLEREYTGRADPRSPTTESENRPRGKLREDDPEFYQTRSVFNDDSLVSQTVHPGGNTTSFQYESTPSPRRRGNLLSILRTPGTHSPAGDQSAIEESFEYGTDFGGCCGPNFITRHVDGRGHETRHEYDDRGNRIRTIHRIPTIVEDFEYNEFGQLTARIWPDNGSGHRRRDEYIYHESGPQRGYLEKLILDSENLALTYSFAYDLVGNLVRLTDPRGDEVELLVNQLDQIVRLISPEVEPGSGVRYELDLAYDANDNLKRIDIQNVDDEGAVVAANPRLTTAYEYEKLNRLVRSTQEVDPGRSVEIEYEYDRNRNLVLVRFGESTNGNQPANTVRLLWDERDLLFQEIRAEGHPDQSTTRYDHDPNGNLRRTSQGLEGTPRVTLATYDGFDRLVEWLDAMGNLTSYGYDENDNLVFVRHDGELVDVEGTAENVRLHEERRTYDELDRPVRRDLEFFDTETQSPVGDGVSTSGVEYSDISQIVRVVNDNGHEARAIYDTMNRLSQVVDHLGNVRSFGYDADSNVTSLTEIDKSDLGRPDQVFTSTYEYDGIERLTSMRDNIGNTWRFGHDSRSNLTSIVDPLGNVVTRSFDGLKRLVSTQRTLTDDGTGDGVAVGAITTRYDWDDSSRLIELRDDNQNSCRYTHDPLNRIIAIDLADGTRHSYAHDVHHNVTAMTDANGSVVTSTYDLLDRLVRNDVTPGPGVAADTTLEVFAHDGLSRLVHAEDDDSLVTRSHDSLSSIVTETLDGESTVAVHDGVGNRLSCTYPGGRTVTCTYDGLERRKTVSDSLGTIAGYFYVGPNRVERCDLGNGTRTEIHHDGITGVPNPPGDFGVRQVIRTTHTRVADGAVIDDLGYRWDSLYNQTRREDLRPGGSGLLEDFDYDSVYRLVRSTRTRPGNPARIVEYALDGVGNRTTVTGGADAGAYTLSDTLPEPGDRQCNQYTQTAFDVRLYDSNGNLLRTDAGAAEVRNFAYDYRNRLVVASDEASGVDATYAYDALGRRVQRIVEGDETRYFYSGWQVVEEQDATGATRATHVHGRDIDEVHESRRESGEVFYHRDRIHNTTALTDETGTVTERYEYDDFGMPSVFDRSGTPLGGSSAVGNPYLFTGRRYDPETGWYYYRTRYLDPRAGRFTTRDTIGVWGDPGNLGNAYTYVTSNPWTRRDPMGLGPQTTQPDPPRPPPPPPPLPELPTSPAPDTGTKPRSGGRWQGPDDFVYPPEMPPPPVNPNANEIVDPPRPDPIRRKPGSEFPHPVRDVPTSIRRRAPVFPDLPDRPPWKPLIDVQGANRAVPQVCRLKIRRLPRIRLPRLPPGLTVPVGRGLGKGLGILAASSADTEGEALLLSLPLLASNPVGLAIDATVIGALGAIIQGDWWASRSDDPDDNIGGAAWGGP